MKKLDKQIINVIIEYFVLFLTIYFVAADHSTDVTLVAEILSTKTADTYLFALRVAFDLFFNIAFSICVLSLTLIMLKLMNNSIKKSKVISKLAMILNCAMYILLILIYGISEVGIIVIAVAITLIKIGFYANYFIQKKRKGVTENDNSERLNENI